nr:uncharacterized protein LOC109166753 [Ipomoea batatas]
MKTYLDSTFKIKDLGKLSYFLGIEAHMKETGLNLCQRKYALDILNEACFINYKSVNTPMLPGHHLNREGSSTLISW